MRTVLAMLGVLVLCLPSPADFRATKDFEVGKEDVFPLKMEFHVFQAVSKNHVICVGTTGKTKDLEAFILELPSTEGVRKGRRLTPVGLFKVLDKRDFTDPKTGETRPMFIIRGKVTTLAK